MFINNRLAYVKTSTDTQAASKPKSFWQWKAEQNEKDRKAMKKKYKKNNIDPKAFFNPDSIYYQGDGVN